jgi:hypothetical protein
LGAFAFALAKQTVHWQPLHLNLVVGLLEVFTTTGTSFETHADGVDVDGSNVGAHYYSTTNGVRWIGFSSVRHEPYVELYRHLTPTQQELHRDSIF